MIVLRAIPHLLVQWDVKGAVYLMNLQVEINPGKVIMIKQLKISQQVNTLVFYNENDSFQSGMWNNTHKQKYVNKQINKNKNNKHFHISKTDHISLFKLSFIERYTS